MCRECECVAIDDMNGTRTLQLVFRIYEVGYIDSKFGGHARFENEPSITFSIKTQLNPGIQCLSHCSPQISTQP